MQPNLEDSRIETPNAQPIAPSNLDWTKFERTLTKKKEFSPRTLLRSFTHAYAGIKETIANEQNFKIQLLCAVAAILAGCACKINLSNCLILTQVIALVLTAEMINTALEHLVDLAAGGFYHPLARAAKDASAGAVLLSSAFAVVSGIFIFGPYVLPLLHNALKSLAG